MLSYVAAPKEGEQNYTFDLGELKLLAHSLKIGKDYPNFTLLNNNGGAISAFRSAETEGKKFMLEYLASIQKEAQMPSQLAQASASALAGAQQMQATK